MKNTPKSGFELSTLPDKPGVYQFLGKDHEIIYVGKAKSIRKRVRSYFGSSKGVSGKTQLMVSLIKDLRFFVVDTELEALLLENSLIKKHQPRYNVQLKDDKSFPWICIKKERFPRVFPTRNPVKDGSDYFGPYASVKMMHVILDFINQLYPLRTCNYDLSEKNIQNKKFRLCLEYHIGNCLGPCEGLQSEKEYNVAIEQIKGIIKGNIAGVINHLKIAMKGYAKIREYEQAHKIKERLMLLKKYQSRSTVVNPRVSNVDVYGIVENDGYAFVNYMKVIEGSIVQTHTVEIKKRLEEKPEELLAFTITNLRERFSSDARTNIVNINPGLAGSFKNEGVRFVVPSKGDKKKLVDLAIRNSRLYMLALEKQKVENSSRSRKTNDIIDQARKDLRLKSSPYHIECFDNSNLQGTNPVAAMVVFVNGKPAKSKYRHYNIRTVSGPDDFASMEEVVFRRYKKLKEEKAPLPNLIVIDGGKGQVSAAMKSLNKLELDTEIGVVGVAKKLEEIYYPNDPVPLYLDKRSPTLKLIQHLRNEAHRFGIAHHRNKRVKETLQTELTQIPGIGNATANALLTKFKSVKNIRKANEEELAEVIGQHKATRVFDHFGL